MKYLFFVISLFLSTAIFAQNPLKAFAEKYNDLEEASNIRLGDWMIKLAAEDDEEKNLLEKITGVHVFSVPSQELVGNNDIRDLKRAVLADNYETLIEVRDDDSFITIYLREDAEAITDLFIVVDGEEDFTAVNLTGRLNYEDLKDIDIDIDGMEAIENVPDKRGR